ncbi:ribbon-helix-helix domain-containing protein [Chloroflexota bacterium]
MSQELKEQLDEIKEMSGKNIGDILREAVGVQSKSVKNAWKRGHSLAKSIYGVTYKCSVCGGNILMESADAKKAAARYMREHGWKHGSCG